MSVVPSKFMFQTPSLQLDMVSHSCSCINLRRLAWVYSKALPQKEEEEGEEKE